jgi:hypothetical protein
MATTPPPDEPRPQETARVPVSGFAASSGDLARLPIPGNAEFLVFLLVWLVIALLWIFSDRVEADLFATLSVALTFGYLVSRGIAKASRVLEQ